MPEQQVGNPTGAYVTGGQGQTPDYGGMSTYQFVATATITANQIVAFDATGNGTIIPCTAALTPVGVAQNASAVGGVVDVCVRGFATVVAGTGGITKQTLVGVLAAGAGGPAAANSLNVGVAITTATATNTAIVFVDTL
jgi:hypothetical protein